MALVTTMLSTVIGGAETFTSITVSGLTASRAVVTDANKALASSATTATELGYVNGVTSAIQTQLNSKSWQLLDSDTASNSATIDLTGFSSTYIAYKIFITNLAVATDAQALWMRTSTDGGNNFDAGASDYGWGSVATQFTATPTPTGAGDDADAQIVLASSLGNAANEIASFEISIFNPNAAAYCHVKWEGVYTNGSTALFHISGGGARLAAADVDAIRFLAASGNLAAGEFRLYGLRGA